MILFLKVWAQNVGAHYTRDALCTAKYGIHPSRTCCLLSSEKTVLAKLDQRNSPSS